MFSTRYASTPVQSLTINHDRHSVQPYDSTLKFNKLIPPSRSPAKPNNKINQRKQDSIEPAYMVDTLEVLKAIVEDKGDDLLKITLAVCTTQNGVGLWDTLFNAAQKHTYSAIVFTATEDYKPIPQSRVVLSTHYLNYTMPSSRIHLNRIIENDKVGIGFYDFTTKMTYVLIYTVTNLCALPAKQTNQRERPSLVPALNLDLLHVLTIDIDNSAEVINIKDDCDYEGELASAFVSWLTESVFDIRHAYSWKPHFVSQIPNSFNRESIENDVKELIDECQQVVEYDTFELACRKLYAEAALVHQARKSEPQETSAGRRPRAILPTIPVISNGTRCWTKVGDESLSFMKDSMSKSAFLETYLLNKDLEGTNLADATDIMVLNSEVFGTDTVIRFLSVRF